jgi:hypothetical protein
MSSSLCLLCCLQRALALRNGVTSRGMRPHACHHLLWPLLSLHLDDLAALYRLSLLLRVSIVYFVGVWAFGHILFLVLLNLVYFLQMSFHRS